MSRIIHHLFGNNKKQQKKLRSQLVSASPELVSSKPSNEIKVEDVTAHSQVSRGTFYQCFSSVDDLLNVSAKQVVQEITPRIESAGSTILDAPLRIATKHKMAIRLALGTPLLAKIMLNAEWPFSDIQNKAYKDIQADIALGIEQGSFTDMPLDIATNIVITILRGAVKEMINSPQPPEYEDQVVYHLLLSLGVDAETAEKISKIPLDQLPDLPKSGLVGKIMKLVGLKRNQLGVVI